MSGSTSTASDYLSPLVAGQLRLAENVPLAFRNASSALMVIVARHAGFGEAARRPG